MGLSRDPIPTSPGGDDHGQGCQVAGLEGKRIMEWPSRLNTRRHIVLTTRDQNNPQRQRQYWTYNDNTVTCVTCCWLLDKLGRCVSCASSKANVSTDSDIGRKTRWSIGQNHCQP